MGLVTVFWPAMTTTGGEFEFQADGEARFVVSIIEVIWLMRLRRTEAVETGGIIRPLWIAEMGRTAGQRVGCQHRPDRIYQIRAGFNYDDQIVGPGDREPELIRLHTKVLRLRIPQHSREPAKSGAPARGTRQVIDGRISVTVNNIRINA